MSIGMEATERLDWATGQVEASEQKSALGGQAILQAVTRVKLEQASKVVMWTPTRPDNGEGSTDREETRAGTRNSPTNEHLIRSTGVLSTACRKSGLRKFGRPGVGGGETSNIIYRMVAGPGVGEGRKTDEAG